MRNIPLSLEFFPPKTPEGAVKLAAARLAGRGPDYGINVMEEDAQ